MMVSDDQRVENRQQKSTQQKNAALLLREDDMFPAFTICMVFLWT